MLNNFVKCALLGEKAVHEIWLTDIEKGNVVSMIKDSNG